MSATPQASHRLQAEGKARAQLQELPEVDAEQPAAPGTERWASERFHGHPPFIKSLKVEWDKIGGSWWAMRGWAKMIAIPKPSGKPLRQVRSVCLGWGR